VARLFATHHITNDELLKEKMEFQSASSLFLLDSTKFGLDMALADGKSYYSNDVTSKV
jgi:hypothetical protein